MRNIKALRAWLFGMALAGTIAAPSPSLALTLSYNFTAAGFQSLDGGTTAPLDPVHGSFSLSADASGLSGTGNEVIPGTASLLSLDLGTTTFTAADVEGVFVFYSNGMLRSVLFGSSCNAGGCLFSAANPTEDFFLLDLVFNGSLPSLMSYGRVDLSDSWATAEALREEVYGTVTLSPIPEPATLVLLGIGLAGLGVARRRKAH